MKLTAPHWVMAVLTLLVFAEPEAATLFPSAAGILGVLDKVMVLAITVLGGASSSAFPTVNSKAVAARTAQVLGALIMIFCLAGCPALVAVVPPSIATVQCVANDALARKTLAQIITDCGGDAVAVITALLTSTDPNVTGSPAYAEAKTLQSRLAALK